MAHTILPDLAIVLAFLREGQGWSQTRLAEAAGTSPNVINDHEAGRKPLRRERLEDLASCMGIPPERIDETLACLAGNRAASRPPGAPGDPFAAVRRRIEAVAAQVGRLAADFARSALLLLTTEGRGAHDRQRAELLWTKLRRRTHAQRLMLVEDAREYRDWALCERVAAESLDAAANHPEEALELARLAVRIAGLAPGEEAWRRRLEGYARAVESNAHRVRNDLRSMEAALAKALKLWEEGAPADPGLLNPAIVPWIEAAVRREQRRFPEALERIDQALDLDRGELRGKILLTKSGILKALGDPEGSTAVLTVAAPLIDGRKDPRLALYLRFNLLSDLCRVGRAEEAAPQLKEISRLAERLGEKLDLTRVVWLGGLTAAGLGKAGDAEAAFQQVRRDFEGHKLAYDYALVSLDLSLLLLEQGRSGDVRKIAEEMLGIFQRLEIGREALMALQVFCQAAQREAATVDLTRRVARFLLRARYDPNLKFEETAGAGA